MNTKLRRELRQIGTKLDGLREDHAQLERLDLLVCDYEEVLGA